MKLSCKENAILNERIERVERQNQRLKYGVGFLILAFFTVGVLGAKSVARDGHFNKIVARSISIVDGSGKERVLIVSDAEGTGMEIRNKRGKRVVEFGLVADESGSGILIADSQGRPRIGLGMDDGIPSLAMADTEGKKLIALGGDISGYGLVVMDKMENERVGLGYKAGNTGVAIYDDEGKYVRGMIRQKDGVHYQSYIDEKGKEVITR